MGDRATRGENDRPLSARSAQILALDALGILECLATSKKESKPIRYPLPYRLDLSRITSGITRRS